MTARASLRVGLAALASAIALVACTGDGEAEPAASPKPRPSLVERPVVGPTPRTVFSIIRELGVRPGSTDEFMIRDLLAVAESQQAHILATGRVGTLEEAKKTKDYRLRGGSKVELRSGVGDPARFCLRSYLDDDNPRQWYFDTNQVLPRGEFCT